MTPRVVATALPQLTFAVDRSDAALPSTDLEIICSLTQITCHRDSQRKAIVHPVAASLTLTTRPQVWPQQGYKYSRNATNLSEDLVLEILLPLDFDTNYFKDSSRAQQLGWERRRHSLLMLLF